MSGSVKVSIYAVGEGSEKLDKRTVDLEGLEDPRVVMETVESYLIAQTADED